jgi:hypothetical protein
MNFKNTLFAATASLLIATSASAVEIVKPEIKASNKRFEVRFNQKGIKSLEVEIRDSYDKVVYATRYFDVSNFERTYNISQLPKGKYFVTIKADGKIYRDVLRVRRFGYHG